MNTLDMLAALIGLIGIGIVFSKEDESTGKNSNTDLESKQPVYKAIINGGFSETSEFNNDDDSSEQIRNEIFAKFEIQNSNNLTM